MRRLFALPVAVSFLALGFVASGCDSEPVGCTDDDPGCGPVGGDLVVDGVNLTTLLAPPTEAERDSAEARLDVPLAPDASPIVSAVVTDLATDTDATRYQLITLRDVAGAPVAYAAARIPAVNGGTGTPRPAILLLPDGQGNASDADFLTGESADELDRDMVQVAVAFRGATLRFRGTSYTSAASATPYRADIGDVVALADRLGLVLRTDRSKVALVGVGRGGAVALLAAERATGRFRAVASLGAPTDLFEPTVLSLARDVLLGRDIALPGGDVLLAPVLAFRAGEISQEEARLRLLDLSAVVAADRLPATLAVHANSDDIVSPGHLARLRSQGDGTVNAPRRFVTVQEGEHATLLASTDVRGALSTFLFTFLAP